MKLSEFFTLTKEGSLHQVNTSQDSLLSFTNLGIQTISDEFNILKKTVVINILENVTQYSLPLDLESIYSITTQGKYWRNLQGKLVDNSFTEFEVSVNVKGDFNSVFITNNTSLTVPYPVLGQSLIIDYKAASPMLTSVTEVLPLANQYILPLMLYVTYLGFFQALGASHQDTSAAFKMYRESINLINNSGTFIPNFGFNTKFVERGFI